MARTTSDEGVARGLAFRPRPSDVIISPYGKSGTTWLQQMVHTLRTGGDIDHDDISSVVPWIETAHDLGIDLDAPQRAEPRAFKSHCSWDRVPRGGRYIVSLRDPRDTVLSLYHFMSGWYFEPGSIAVDDFAIESYLTRPDERSYWGHFISWYEQRDRDDVLLLVYERMLRDPAATIRRVAAFAGIELDDELLATTLAQTSIEFMLEHKHLFDDRLMRDLSERQAGLPPGAESAKVRSGKAGGGKATLSPAVVARFDERWQASVGERLGLASYEAAVAALD